MSTAKHSTAARTSNVQPVLRVSVAAGPLLDIVDRHVKLSTKVRRAIERDLIEAINQSVSTSASVTAERTEPHDEILSTEQAAQLLDVSRPHVVKLLDTGVLPLHQRVGNQRRVLKSAVLSYRTKERSRQSKALKRLGADLDDEIFNK